VTLCKCIEYVHVKTAFSFFKFVSNETCICSLITTSYVIFIRFYVVLLFSNLYFFLFGVVMDFVFPLITRLRRPRVG
jgi:hypothetical protein